MKKPIILVTHRPEEDPVKFSVGGIHGIRANYLSAIIKAGGVPVITAYGDIEAYASIADGVLFTGAPQDVDPARYGDTVRKADQIDKQLDNFEFGLFDLMRSQGKPIMGICRGIQMINVAMGGTLYQDLETEGPPITVHQPSLDHFNDAEYAEHPAKTKEGTLMRRLFGEDMFINSFHHQAVKDVGKGMIASITTEEGIIEAIEHESEPIFAVQWHPEREIGEELTHQTNMMPMFEYFVNLCKK